MDNRHSELDRKNISSFAADQSRASLKSISLTRGEIRGLSNFRIEFSYPLSAVAGRNGSGKSTVLALASCAFHARPKDWFLQGRRLPYYRFSDFFVQTKDEVPVEGVTIGYEILYDNWKPTDAMPKGKGLGFQKRVKSPGGKWNDYDTRVKRPVAFFGIDRVVPPSEKSVLKNQKKYFSVGAARKSDIEESARKSVSRVLGIDYEDFEIRGAGVHKLPLVKRKGIKYSGFNMGAGEQALFGMFSVIHSPGKPTLFVIDEIELGLHEAAQRNLIHELKRISHELRHQFIFTTHSAAVLESLPPEARFFLERTESGTKVVEGVSPAFAAGRLADKETAELNIYVEDVSAKQLIISALTNDVRRRVRVIEVGSHSAVISQIAAKFVDRRHEKTKSIAFLDGDQRSAFQSHRSRFLGLVDQRHKSAAAQWFDEKIGFLPSELMPERFVVSLIRENHIAEFCRAFGIENELEASTILDKSLVRGDHSEIYWMSEDLFLPEDQVWQLLCAIVSKDSSAYFDEIRRKILDSLD
jgi:ABC-type multidrug transport system ATPase subunit